MIICIQSNPQRIFSENQFNQIFRRNDGYRYLLEKNSNREIPFCLWDNLRPPPNQEVCFVNCLRNLKRFDENKFAYSCDMLQNDIERIEELQTWLTDSAIITKQECRSLIKMTQSRIGILLYRATRDGFAAKAFHQKCDGKVNTITIIRNNANYVFGGYASAAWNSAGAYIIDANAFIFSLRRNGNSENHKFMIKNGSSGDAIHGGSTYGPLFGRGHEIDICDQSNKSGGSSSNIGRSYEPPPGVTYNTDIAKSFFAGSYNGWTTTEIEVYQIN